MGEHSDLESMSYGELHALSSGYFARAMLSQVAKMDDAGLAAWALAQQNGESMEAQRLASLRARIRMARQLGL